MNPQPGCVGGIYEIKLEEKCKFYNCYPRSQERCWLQIPDLSLTWGFEDYIIQEMKTQAQRRKMARGLQDKVVCFLKKNSGARKWDLPIRREEGILLPMRCSVAQSCPTLCDPMDPTLTPTGLLCPWEFSRQEYWSGLPCPAPGDLPHPGIEPALLTSPILAGRFFTTSATWEAPAHRRSEITGRVHNRDLIRTGPGSLRAQLVSNG